MSLVTVSHIYLEGDRFFCGCYNVESFFFNLVTAVQIIVLIFQLLYGFLSSRLWSSSALLTILYYE